MAEETKGTVVLALAANVGVAAAKLVAGLLSGSSALLAEAAHSVADSLNEVFLLVSLRRGEREADAQHPFGYGGERFFWSLLAAVGIFVVGAGYSIMEGISRLRNPGGEVSSREFLLDYLVLGVSFLLEGSSLIKALRQTRGEARTARRRFLTYVRRSPDPTVKTVASEDSAALVGLALAGAGTALHQVTGNGRWDGLASIAVGVLLVFVAYFLGSNTKDLLIGQAADPKVRLQAYDVIRTSRGVTGIKEMLTMQLGPDSVMVGARVDFDDDLTASDVEVLSDEIEARLQAVVPQVRQVFLDPSRVTSEDIRASSKRLARTRTELTALEGEGAAERLRDPAPGAPDLDLPFPDAPAAVEADA